MNLSAVPEISFAIGILLFVLFGLIADRGIKTRAILPFIAILILLITLFYIGKNFPRPDQHAFSELFATTKYIECGKCIILISAALSILLSLSQSVKFEFSVLVLLATLGMLVLLSANDFMSMYVGFELQALCSYCLVAFKREDIKGAESGVKYFILGVVASGILLYGISFIYGFSGTTNFSTLSRTLQTYSSPHLMPVGILLGMTLVMAGLAFKMAAAPFHFWAPDVYEGAPLSVTAFLATTSKAAAVMFSLNLINRLFGAWDGMQKITQLIAILSLFIGALGGLRQHNIKRLLAYSSISHVGFMLIGIAAYNDLSANAVVNYIMIYISMNIGIFACISILQKGEENFDLEIFKGLGKNSPILAGLFTILLLSLAGIPPFGGFLAKFYILNTAIKSHLYGLVCVGMLSAIISTFYYLRIIKLMYFDTNTLKLETSYSKINITLAFGAALINAALIFFPSILDLQI